MRFIGITGGIGAGKSEILSYIGKHYRCRIYLADEVAHLVKEPGTDCFLKLTALLGREILTPEGRIDKKKMAEKIFADRELLEKVNAIVHPAVKTFLMEKLEEAGKEGNVDFFFVEAALLIECGYGALVDEMWYIYASEEVRRKRLKEARGYSDEKITAIMQKQLAEEDFRKSCSFVIDNSGSLEESYRQIDKRLNSAEMEIAWQK